MNPNVLSITPIGMYWNVAILNYFLELELSYSQWEFLKYYIENFNRNPGTEHGISVQQAEAISITPRSSILNPNMYYTIPF